MKNLFYRLASVLFFAPAVLAQSGPVANNDEYTTDWDTPLVVAAPGVLANDIASGTILEAHVNQWPGEGSLSMETDGSFVYEPIAGRAGDITFSYNAWDGQTAATATVTIRITDGNQAPVAQDDTYTIGAERLYVDAPGVLANDSDPEGDTLITYLATPPASGVLGFHQDGSFWYDPDPTASRTVTFDYKVFDGKAWSLATVTLNAGSGLNAVDDDFAFDFNGGNQTVTIYPLQNDEGSNLRITSATGQPYYYVTAYDTYLRVGFPITLDPVPIMWTTP